MFYPVGFINSFFLLIFFLSFLNIYSLINSLFFFLFLTMTIRAPLGRLSRGLTILCWRILCEHRLLTRRKRVEGQAYDTGDSLVIVKVEKNERILVIYDKNKFKVSFLTGTVF